MNGYGAEKAVAECVVFEDGWCDTHRWECPNRGVYTPTSDAAIGDALYAVEKFVRRFCVLPTEHAYPTVALWVAHTYLMDCWDSTPRLAALSPEPASGKSRLLEVVSSLVPNPMEAVNATPAALFRKIGEKPPPTILYDECDTVWGTRRQAEQNEDVRALINAGHRRSGSAWRCVGLGTAQKAVEFPAYSAVFLAGLGQLPRTILTRSIVLRMRRRTPDERVQPWRALECEAEGAEIAERLKGALIGKYAFGAGRPSMPASIQDRDADKWEPLFVIAEYAGPDWLKRTCDAAEWFVTESQSVDNESLGLRLLADLRDVWTANGDPEHLATVTLIEQLRKIPESPWDDLGGKALTDRRLGSLLRTYGVRSRDVATLTGTRKGYRREDLWDSWKRYLPTSPTQGR